MWIGGWWISVAKWQGDIFCEDSQKISYTILYFRESSQKIAKMVTENSDMVPLFSVRVYGKYKHHFAIFSVKVVSACFFLSFVTTKD